MEKITKISLEDLQAIHNAKANAAYMQVLEEKAHAEKSMAELQVKNITLMAFLKYGLSGNDSIDNQGNIFRAESVEPAPVPDVSSNENLTKKKR